MSAASAIQLLIVDDHPVVRAGLRSVLARDRALQVIAEAECPVSALECFRRYRPHVVVMDIRLGDHSGIHATRAIRAEFPSARVVMLTSYQRVDDIHAALREGAQGFLYKTTESAKLIETIRRVHAGERVLPPEVARRVAEDVFVPQITDREHEVLNLMVDGKRNRVIARELGISTETVKAHVKNILRKLDVSDRTEAATLALRRGLVRMEN